jgi:putative endonuclease
MPEHISITRFSTASNVGEEGERIAAAFLEANGYRLVISNFKVPVGRNSKGVQVTGEIDIIAVDPGGVLCFVEVKTRTSDAFAGPLSAVDLRKQRQITRTSKIYKRVFGLWKSPARYDVVTVVMPPGGSTKVELIRGFWTEEKFRKRRWEAELYRDNF